MSIDHADYLAERASVTEVLRSLVDSPSDLQSTLQVILDKAGTILASQRTIAASETEATLLPNPLSLKGIPQPVPVYSV